MDRYRLGPLRQVRDHAERAKRNDLAVAVGDARVTAEEVAAAAGRVEAARAVLAKAQATSCESAHELALRDRYIARLRGRLDDAVAEHARARAAHAGKLASLDTARGALTAARADKELVERHFAQWRKTQQKLAERRED